MRYFYDNPKVDNTFVTALHLEGISATGALISAPLDTRSVSSVVEISNTPGISVKVAVDIYRATGGKAVYSKSIKLAKYSSYQITVDSLIVNSQGIVTADSDTKISIIASVLQYGRNSSGALNYAHGVQARESVGSVMRGTFNMFLNQGCSLLLSNSSDNTQSTSISLLTYDGKSPVPPYVVSIPAHGLVNEDICIKNVPNIYGVATVQPQTSNSIYGTMVRLGANDHYRFPTPVRQ